MTQRHLHIADNYRALDTEINEIERHFSSGKVTLHNQRNVIKQFELANRAVVVKSFKQPNAIQGWIYAKWRPSKARRSFEHAVRLEQLDVNTHTPIAYSETRHRGRLTNSYFFSERIEHDFTIRDELLKDAEFDPLLLAAFVDFSFDLHEKQVLHLDHSPGNTLVKKTADGYRFSIIDINRMQFRPLTLHQRMTNFCRLSNHVDVLRFIANHYATLANADPDVCFGILRKQQLRDDNARRRKCRLKAWLGQP